MTKDISAMAFWKAAGPYSEGVSHRFTDSLRDYYVLTHGDRPSDTNRSGILRRAAPIYLGLSSVLPRRRGLRP